QAGHRLLRLCARQYSAGVRPGQVRPRRGRARPGRQPRLRSRRLGHLPAGCARQADRRRPAILKGHPMRSGPRRPSRWVRRLVAAALGGVVMSAGVATLTAPQASAEPDGSDTDTLTAAMDGAGIDSLNPFLALANGAYDTFALI